PHPGRDRGTHRPRPLPRRRVHGVGPAGATGPRPLSARRPDSGAWRQAQAPLSPDRPGRDHAGARAHQPRPDGARPRAEAGGVVRRPPPRLARALVAALIPGEFREEIVGDLDEIWSRGGASRLRYWRLATGSIAACALDGVRRREVRARSAPPPRRGDGAMSSLAQDIAYGLRLLPPAPGFPLAAVAALALGIGVNAAPFSIVNVLSLKPLPYAHPERVAFVMAWDAERRERRMNLPLADIADIAAQARTLEAIAAYRYWSANLLGGDTPERVQAYQVTG